MWSDLSFLSGGSNLHQFYDALDLLSQRALAREGDYKMPPEGACLCALVCHADFSKTATATDVL